MVEEIKVENQAWQEIEEVQDVLIELSEAFQIGLGKLTAKDKQVYDKIKEGFASTPLSEKVKESMEKLHKSEFTEEAVSTLVYSVVSLNGAIYDGLYKSIENSRSFKDIGSEEYEDYQDEVKMLLENIKKWLITLIIDGFDQIKVEHIEAFSPVMEKIDSYPELQRLNVVLRGIINEWVNIGAKKKNDKLENYGYRWFDLWVRTYMLTQQKRISKPTTINSGNLYLLGEQHHVHEEFLLVLLKGILERDQNDIYFVELEFPMFLSSLINMNEFYSMIRKNNEKLFNAFEKNNIIKIKDASISSNGILKIEKYNITEKTFDLKTLYQPGNLFEKAALIKKNPLDRHPNHFNLPFYTKNLAKLSIEAEKKEEKGTIVYLKNNLPIDQSKIEANSHLLELKYDNGYYWNVIQQYDMTKGTESLTKINREQDYNNLVFGETTTYNILKERSSKVLRG